MSARAAGYFVRLSRIPGRRHGGSGAQLRFILGNRGVGSMGGNTVPIRPFLSGEAFDPETIQSMNDALSAACQALRLKEKEDAATRLLAMRIIDLAKDGVHDRQLLKAAALLGFKQRAE